KPMDFPPGSRFSYNNSGYILLGMLIEKLTGSSWSDDLASRFAEPLGLADLRNCLVSPIIPRRVSGYSRDESGVRNAQYLAMSQPYAAGALCATIADLATWNRALHTGRVVSEDSYRRMITPAGAAVSSRYGFGLALDTLAGRTIVTHGGGINGFASGNAWEPESQLSVTVLTNTDAESPDELLKQLVRVALGQPLLTRPPVVPLAASDRDSYVGTYLMEMPGQIVEFVVAAAGTGLTGRFGPQRPIPMVHYGNHVFGADFDPTLRLIFTMDGGRAARMTLRQRGASFEGALRAP
ncbi:MAG TPA: serine hydrolase domain-containing protein, partial [Gemmatimonadales bacterium]|nr:serine hydrolase domain-containing protein [Gemmatimonadales bacterium]